MSMGHSGVCPGNILNLCLWYRPVYGKIIKRLKLILFCVMFALGDAKCKEHSAVGPRPCSSHYLAIDVAKFSHKF